MEKNQKIRVLERAFDIIEAFGHKDPELSLVEIADRTGLPLATVHRSLQTMLSRGYLEQDSKSGKFRLGMQFVRLSGLVLGRMDLVRVATPYLEDLAKATGQNVNLSVYDDGKALCLINLESREHFVTGIKVGQRLPIYAGALSKVILAYLPPDVVSSLITDDLTSFTPQTIARKEALLTELDDIRNRGYAASRGELAIGVAALAAPVFDYNRRAVAGIAISGPDELYTEGRQREFLDVLLSTARTISAQLGAP